jgi:cell division protein FtsN
VNGRRLSVRDYKRSRRGGVALEGSALRPFALGLALGLALAAAVFIADRRGHVGAHAMLSTAVATAGPPAHSASGQGAAPQAAGSGPAGSGGSQSTALPKYDFYQMLSRSQVLIPGRESEARVSAGGPIDRPGTYYLQIGSYRDAATAERMRSEADKLGVMASVQLIVVNTAAWHRVRVGPISDLTVLNRVRRQLQAGNLAALVVRVNP